MTTYVSKTASGAVASILLLLVGAGCGGEDDVELASASIGPEGGLLDAAPDLVVEFPIGAVAETTEVSLVRQAADIDGAVVYRLEPTDLEFAAHPVVRLATASDSGSVYFAPGYTGEAEAEFVAIGGDVSDGEIAAVLPFAGALYVGDAVQERTVFATQITNFVTIDGGLRRQKEDLAGANIALVTDAGATLQPTVAADGHLRFDGVPAGPVWLSVPVAGSNQTDYFRTAHSALDLGCTAINRDHEIDDGTTTLSVNATGLDPLADTTSMELLGASGHVFGNGFVGQEIFGATELQDFPIFLSERLDADLDESLSLNRIELRDAEGASLIGSVTQTMRFDAVTTPLGSETAITGVFEDVEQRTLALDLDENSTNVLFGITSIPADGAYGVASTTFFPLLGVFVGPAGANIPVEYGVPAGTFPRGFVSVGGIIDQDGAQTGGLQIIGGDVTAPVRNDVLEAPRLPTVDGTAVGGDIQVLDDGRPVIAWTAASSQIGPVTYAVEVSSADPQNPELLQRFITTDLSVEPPADLVAEGQEVRVTVESRVEVGGIEPVRTTCRAGLPTVTHSQRSFSLLRN